MLLNNTLSPPQLPPVYMFTNTTTSHNQVVQILYVPIRPRYEGWGLTFFLNGGIHVALSKWEMTLWKRSEGPHLWLYLSVTVTADERKLFEVDEVLFLQWLRLNTDAHAEQHIHHFSDTFSGRSLATAEINSPPVPFVCKNALTHTSTHMHKQKCNSTQIQVSWVCKGHMRMPERVTQLRHIHGKL